MKRDIVDRRRNPQGKVTRILECGHEQPEPSGGKAHLAGSAVCKLCVEKKNELLPRRPRVQKVLPVPPPVRDEPSDMRCGVPVDGGSCPNPVDNTQWCFGCAYYVCAEHDLHRHEITRRGALGHEPARHLEGFQ